MNLFLLCLALLAPSPFQTEYEARRAKNPADAQLSIRVLDQKRFHAGELIGLEVDYKAPPRPAKAPPSKVYTFAGFVLHPGPSCDMTHPCGVMDMRTTYKFDPMFSIDMKREPFTADLNGYVPRLKPGKYRAYLRLQKQELKSHGPMQRTFGYAAPAAYVVSNLIEFEIVPATPEWIRSTVAQARETIEHTDPQGRGGWERRTRAARQLRFVQHPLAWEAALDLEGSGAGLNDLVGGLYESPERAQVCKRMRERIPRPTFRVSYYFADITSEICARVKFPLDRRPRSKDPNNDPKVKQWWQRSGEYKSRLMGEDMERLAASLRAKQGPALTAAFDTLLQRWQSIQNDRFHPRPLPAWTPQLSETLATAFVNAQPHQLRTFLGAYWPLLRKLEVAAVIEKIIAQPARDGSQVETRNLALRRLCEIAPEKGRRQLFEELRDFRTSADLEVFTLLPPEAVGNVDDILIRNLASAQLPPYGDGAKAMLLISRYASPRVLKRMKAIYESQQDPCTPGLIAYFLRTDPAYAGSIFKKQPWDMHAPPPRCAERFFGQVPPLRMHKVLEDYMIAFLQHERVPTKVAAASGLSRYGSSAAEEPLWQAFRYFHNWWKDRKQDLARDEFVGNIFLEQELRNALARGHGWLVDECKLKQMEALCLGERCVYDAANDLRAWRQPLRIEINLYSFYDFQATVAQYYNIRSLEALKWKVAEFPQGTAFELAIRVPPDDAQKNVIASELESLAASHGFRLTAVE